MHIELTELNFIDGQVRELVVNADSIRDLIPWAVGTVVECFDGRIHVHESTYEIKQLILRARQHRFATLADLPPDPDEEFFATGSLPGPVYARNRIQSRPEDLTVNGVDLGDLIEQDERMLDRIRTDALGE